MTTNATVVGVAVPAVPTGFFIGGRWREATGGATFDAVAPSTEERLATISSAFGEAVAMANDTRYGLAAYVWTNDLAAAHRVAARVRAGSVWIDGPGAPDARLPWGGLKRSGVGRELGWAGIEASTEEKTVTITL